MDGNSAPESSSSQRVERAHPAPHENPVDECSVDCGRLVRGWFWFTRRRCASGVLTTRIIEDPLWVPPIPGLFPSLPDSYDTDDWAEE